RPRNVIVLPVLFEGDVKAVIELASTDDFTGMHVAFLEQLTDIIGVVFNNIEVTMRTERLLAQSQQLASEQQSQQQELQKTNEELAQKAQLLAAQNAEVERKNQEIEQARRALEEKAAELALTSRYKSEFLANMSHELRTPLNSILVLGQQLAENAQKNLSERQVEYASTIRAAGTDLLNLISDILDLSKIESGTVTVEAEEVTLVSLKKTIERNFRHEAEARDLTFATELARSLSRTIHTDPKRLLQVLKNLLSNAFKFTEHGSVKLRVFVAEKGWSSGHPILDFSGEPVIAFEVSDTGIGIPPDKQRIIFEAFQQADAGTARKHGGTGLGLAISRELAQLLGGEIRVSSKLGTGSKFTLYLPAVYAGPALPASNAADALALPGFPSMLATAPRSQDPGDDREHVSEGDPVILIAHRDGGVAAMILEAAHAAGLKGIITSRGEEAVTLARRYRPTAVSLDDSLPDAHGWTVLSRFKHDPELRHIPVQMFVGEAERIAARMRGAWSSLTGPVTTADVREDLGRMLSYAGEAQHRLLVVEGGGAESGKIAELLSSPKINASVAASGRKALDLLSDQSFDCVVLDALLRDMPATELLKESAAEPRLRNVPFVIYGDGGWYEQYRKSIEELRRTVAVRVASSLAVLLDDCWMFLHARVSDLPDSRRQLLIAPQDQDVLADKTVLVVDDDVRNIFALSGLLERQDMKVV
ncbi:MAG TPA: ATP-binding protein, partial [Woeseiaceae bacterium]|nr:ATP-binding protein [Woeseiaceae bacterium]